MMNFARFLFLLIPLAAISCEREFRPGVANSPAKDRAEPVNDTFAITIDGRKGTPDETRAWKSVTEKLITTAISRAVSKAIDEFFGKLGPTDKIDHEVLKALDDAFRDLPAGAEVGEAEGYSICMFRTGALGQPLQTAVIENEGRPFLRLTRLYVLIDRPIAVLTRDRVLDGTRVQDKVIVEYDPVNGWQPVRAKQAVLLARKSRILNTAEECTAGK